MKSPQWREASSRERGSASPPPGSSQITETVSQSERFRKCEVTLCEEMLSAEGLTMAGQGIGGCCCIFIDSFNINGNLLVL